MSQTDVPPIGERIRAARSAKGVSVRGLAREIGVSASLISQIETDKSQPSVSTLYAITTALGVSIEQLFAVSDGVAGTALGDGADALPGHTAAAQRAVTADAPVASPGDVLAARSTPEGDLAPAESPAADSDEEAPPRPPAADSARRVGPVVGPADREALTLDSGVVWELLGKVPGSPVDFLRVTYLPGGSSSGSGLLMRHSGTEYGYLLSGELTLTLGFDEHHLGPGDAISFESTTPHGYRNEGAEPAVGVWFVLEHSG